MEARVRALEVPLEEERRGRLRAEAALAELREHLTAASGQQVEAAAEVVSLRESLAEALADLRNQEVWPGWLACAGLRPLTPTSPAPWLGLAYGSCILSCFEKSTRPFHQ